MIALSKEVLKKIKDGYMDKESLVQYLMRNHNLYEITESLAEFIFNVELTDSKPIVVSEDDYQKIISMFRIRGYSVDGTPNLQGRPKRKDSPEV